MPSLVQRASAGVTVLTDPELVEQHRIMVAFSLRHGGVSVSPYASLNLAAHVDDDPVAVDTNRGRLLTSLGLGALRERLTTAEQVHGDTVAAVGDGEAGAGAFAQPLGAPPVAATDALVTIETATPLLLMFADCVPVVLVATGPRPCIAVVHAGWRGALAGIPARAVERMIEASGCGAAELRAYIGPHIGPCHYQVDETLLSQFVHTFGTIVAPQGRLDLGAVVSESLNGVGVPLASQFSAGICTAERTDSFYSHRAEGRTGRHGAVACIL